MTGIREKKKIEYKNRILEASKKLFLNQGYDATTAEQIAEMAGLGVGTVYNYFKSKSDIFIATISEEFEFDKDFDVSSISSFNKGVADVVYEFINNYVKGTKFFGKKLIRELIAAAFGSFKNNPDFMNKLMKLDFKFVDDLAKLLEFLKEKGALKKDYDAVMGAELLYSTIVFEIITYTYSEDISFDECKEKIRKKLEFYFRF